MLQKIKIQKVTFLANFWLFLTIPDHDPVRLRTSLYPLLVCSPMSDPSVKPRFCIKNHKSFVCSD